MLEETLPALAHRIRGCVRCHRDGLTGVGTWPVPGEGSSSAEVLLVGEAPGVEEEARTRPFIGKSGRILREELARAGIPAERCYFGNVVRCRSFAPDAKGRRRNCPPSRSQRENCCSYLLREAELLRPRLVIALGGVAAKLFFGPSFSLERSRGQVLQARGHSVLATCHPASLLAPARTTLAVRTRRFRADLRTAAEWLSRARSSQPGPLPEGASQGSPSHAS